MNLNNLTQAVHDQVRKLSNLDRFIRDKTFIDFFNSVTDFHKEKILLFIRDFKYDELKDYLNKIKERKIESMCVRDLRFLAAQCKIYRYSYLSKEELRESLNSILLKEKKDGTN
jgi:heme oxygenase